MVHGPPGTKAAVLALNFNSVTRRIAVQAADEAILRVRLSVVEPREVNLLLPPIRRVPPNRFRFAYRRRRKAIEIGYQRDKFPEPRKVLCAWVVAWAYGEKSDFQKKGDFFLRKKRGEKKGKKLTQKSRQKFPCGI